MKPYIIITPAPDISGIVYLGQKQAGTLMSCIFTITAMSGQVIVGGVAMNITDPDFTLTPLTPFVTPTNYILTDRQTGTFRVDVNKPGAGIYNTNLNITWHEGSSLTNPITLTIPLRAIFKAVGTALTFDGAGNAAIVVFPNGSNMTFSQFYTVTNNTAAPVTINSITWPNHPMFQAASFPHTLNAGVSFNFLMSCDYTEVGVVSERAVVDSTLVGIADVFMAAVGSFAVTPVDHVLDAGAIMLFFEQVSAASIKQLDPLDLNSDIDSVLVFNGAIYSNPGYEKILRRLEVFYEDVGDCTGLVLELKVWRPNLIAGPFVGTWETKTYTITLSNATGFPVVNDSKELSTYFDTNISGEIIVATLTRTASTGPCSLIGFIPWFEDKGEKVEGV